MIDTRGSGAGYLVTVQDFIFDRFEETAHSLVLGMEKRAWSIADAHDVTLEVLGAEPARVEFAFHAHEVFLLDLAVLADQLARDAPVLRHHQQADGIDVEPPRWRQAAQLLR